MRHRRRDARAPRPSARFTTTACCSSTYRFNRRYRYEKISTSRRPDRARRRILRGRLPHLRAHGEVEPRTCSATPARSPVRRDKRAGLVIMTLRTRADPFDTSSADPSSQVLSRLATPVLAPSWLVTIHPPRLDGVVGGLRVAATEAKKRRPFMITLRRILVPTDFSETSAAALSYGIELARHFAARLFCLHVAEHPGVAEQDPIGIFETTQNAAHDRLRQLLTGEELKELQPDCAMRIGANPLDEIVRICSRARRRSDRHGHARARRDGRHRQRGGESRAKGAPCPVLTVHHPERDSSCRRTRSGRVRRDSVASHGASARD